MYPWRCSLVWGWTIVRSWCCLDQLCSSHLALGPGVRLEVTSGFLWSFSVLSWGNCQASEQTLLTLLFRRDKQVKGINKPTVDKSSSHLRVEEGFWNEIAHISGLALYPHMRVFHLGAGKLLLPGCWILEHKLGLCFMFSAVLVVAAITASIYVAL